MAGGGAWKVHPTAPCPRLPIPLMPLPTPPPSLSPCLAPMHEGGPGGGVAWGGVPMSRRSLSLPPGTEQSQPVAFPPSTEPAFVTVPQSGFGEPFVLNPGTWALLVEAEGVLLVRWG